MTDILGIPITAEQEDAILEEVVTLIKKGEKFTITTPNPEIIVYAKKHKQYQTILNNASVSLPDGVGLLMAAIMLGKPLKTRVTGVDFIENLCKFTRGKPVSMGFLGGGAGVAERAVECLRKKYPWIKVSFVGEEWPMDENGELRIANSKEEKEPLAISHKPLATIDILFVAFGAPKQEIWIAENLERLPIIAAMGVGGAFDYLSGNVVRAPKLIRALGLEWLFRLMRQPWRWKRQLALIEFVWLVVKEKLR